MNSTPSLVIMLVDDEPSVLCALRLLLMAFGHSVIECAGGEIALNKLTDGAKPDLILCDLKMPKIDGIQLLEEIRGKAISTPFVLMSAHALNDEIQRAQRAGMNAFLSKPFTPDQLKAAVASLAPAATSSLL